MPTADEIARPGGKRTAGLRAVLGTQHVADERGQAFFVVGGGASEHEAVAQVPDHVALLRAKWRTEHSRAVEN
jgi:hypothetical protein